MTFECGDRVEVTHVRCSDLVGYRGTVVKAQALDPIFSSVRQIVNIIFDNYHGQKQQFQFTNQELRKLNILELLAEAARDSEG